MPSITRVLSVGRAVKMPADMLLSVTMRSCTRRSSLSECVMQTVLISQYAAEMPACHGSE